MCSLVCLLFILFTLVEKIRPSDLPALLDLMSDMAHKWFAFGVMLNISSKELDSIRGESNGNNQQTLRGVMEQWLRGTSLPGTWPELINVLRLPMVGAKDISASVAILYREKTEGEAVRGIPCWHNWMCVYIPLETMCICIVYTWVSFSRGWKARPGHYIYSTSASSRFREMHRVLKYPPPSAAGAAHLAMHALGYASSSAYGHLYALHHLPWFYGALPI